MLIALHSAQLLISEGVAEYIGYTDKGNNRYALLFNYRQQRTYHVEFSVDIGEREILDHLKLNLFNSTLAAPVAFSERKPKMLDPKEAPEGFEAVEADFTTCRECVFSGKTELWRIGTCSLPEGFHCFGSRRADRTTVIFRKLPEQQK